MFDKAALSGDMIVAFLKDANVTGADVNPLTNKVTLHLDEGEPDVSFDLSPLLTKYVLAEVGRGLSTNDFTDGLKTKLEALQAQVQVNWDENDTTHIEYIRNKPNVYLPAAALRAVLDKLTADANGNLLYNNKPVDSVQPDWDETNATHKTFIQNKPDVYLPTTAVRGVLDKLGADGNSNLLYNGVVVSGVQSDWNETDATDKSYIKNKPDIAGLDHANRNLLDHLGTDADGKLTYNNVKVDEAQEQSDWTETDNTKASYIKNKKEYYLPQDTTNRAVLHSMDKTAGGDVTIEGNKVIFDGDILLITKATTANQFGTVSSIELVQHA